MRSGQEGEGAQLPRDGRGPEMGHPFGDEVRQKEKEEGGGCGVRREEPPKEDRRSTGISLHSLDRHDDLRRFVSIGRAPRGSGGLIDPSP